MSSVFYRAAEPIEAVEAKGCWITDSAGRRYLDAAGGAIVSAIGHGRTEIGEVITAQCGLVDYVHASVFTSSVLEEYCAALSPLLPMPGPRIYPVSGGSEATETAIKMARAYQLARGRPERTVVLSRENSYHGNTLGALDLSGRPTLRAPYEEWLARFRRLPPEFDPGLVEQAINARDDVAAFIVEPIGGASTGALLPPKAYLHDVLDICRRHDVLFVADEVMTGFGRTGTWFGVEHFGVEPDLLVAGKGASSGYWPLGLSIASSQVHEVIADSFVHGFTNSHHPIGAAVGLAVLRILQREELVEAAVLAGGRLGPALERAFPEAEVRGAGALLGIEFPEGPGTPALVAAARSQGLLVYPCAKENTVLLGPPLIISESEIEEIVIRLTQALRLF